MQPLLDECREALNEDMSYILLGELPPSVKKRPTDRLDWLQKMSNLVEELSELTRELAWITDLDPASVSKEEMPPEARRLREIAATLTQLFDQSADRTLVYRS
jgi:hypothetical protein